MYSTTIMKTDETDKTDTFSYTIEILKTIRHIIWKQMFFDPPREEKKREQNKKQE